jgi:hypothetical protein
MNHHNKKPRLSPGPSKKADSLGLLNIDQFDLEIKNSI